MGVMWEAIAKRVETRAPADCLGIGHFLFLSLLVICATIFGIVTVLVVYL